jgi:hypothetical protein
LQQEAATDAWDPSHFINNIETTKMISTIGNFKLPEQDLNDPYYHRFSVMITDVGNYPSFVCAIHPKSRAELLSLMVIEPNEDSKKSAVEALLKKMDKEGWTRLGQGHAHHWYSGEAALARALNGSPYPELTREQLRRINRAKHLSSKNEAARQRNTAGMPKP